MKWTTEEIEFLKANYVDKIPLESIADKLDRSRQSIKRKAQEIGLHREWVRFNKPIFKESKGFIDKRYYKKNKQKIYQRKMDRRKQLKKEAVDIAGGKCKKCEYNKCIHALEFHHYENNKEGNVSTLLKMDHDRSF